MISRVILFVSEQMSRSILDILLRSNALAEPREPVEVVQFSGVMPILLATEALICRFVFNLDRHGISIELLSDLISFQLTSKGIEYSFRRVDWYRVRFGSQVWTKSSDEGSDSVSVTGSSWRRTLQGGVSVGADM